jgi:hypothetical protein
VRDVANENLGPVGEDAAREGLGKARGALLQERPLLPLLPKELLDVPREVDLQGMAPSIRCRAAISTVRSQSLYESYRFWVSSGRALSEFPSHLRQR